MHYLHSIKYFLFTFISLIISFSSATATEEKPTVLVSIAPHRAFVEAIAGDTVDVAVVVPAGASSHTFEPTPRQMMQVGKADIWFRVGEGFEPRLAEVIESYHPEIVTVNMREGVDLIRVDDPNHQGALCCHHDFEDIHFWLSPREAKAQAKNIAQALSKEYPKNASLYDEGLKKIILRLDKLDAEISQQFKEKKGAIIMVSHPAYAYFARDYGLQQVSIEFEGKDPTPQQLTKILELGREHGIKKIFSQPQHRGKGAEIVARQLGAEVVILDPYSEEYFENMRKIASEFSTDQTP